MIPTLIAVGSAAALMGLTLGRVVSNRSRSRSIEAYSQLVVDRLPLGVVVLDAADQVVMANAAAHEMDLIRGGRLAVGGLHELAVRTRTSGDPQEAEMSLPIRGVAREPTAVMARTSRATSSQTVALLVEDVSESRRMEAVRHDFVANVSHELKTPIGALSLLAEAVGDASDSPEDVRRFASRMRHESTRLGQLVQELIELSRLQGGEPRPAPEAVPIDAVVAEAVDATRLVAIARSIAVEVIGPRDLSVLGVRRQLVTAIGNLLDNAIRYSPEGSRVGITVRPGDDSVDIEVRDQGLGIATADIDRVFERFYRADAARSRATGGTGLGLSIVKHVATNHGGRVDVISTEGVGSVFTLHLPALNAAAVRRVRHPARPRMAEQR